jgi:hypothetical protein
MKKVKISDVQQIGIGLFTKIASELRLKFIFKNLTLDQVVDNYLFT